jgi:glycosyltransferase 2 family protein
MKKLIKLGITVIILTLIILHFDIDFSTLRENIMNEKFLWFNLLIPFLLLFISANRWKLFLKQLNIYESTASLIKISCITMFQGLVLPSSQGHDVLRIYRIEKRHPEKQGSAGSTVLIERMFGIVILCLLCLVFSMINTQLPNQKSVIFVIVLLTLILFLIIAISLNERIRIYISTRKFSNKYLEGGLSYVDKMHHAIATFPYQNILLSSTLLILIFQLTTIINVYFVFKAYGFDIPFFLHISLYPIISILSMIPITISGLGVREGFFVFFYNELGVPAETAVIVSLLNYLFLIGIPAILGFLFYIFDTFCPEKQ